MNVRFIGDAHGKLKRYRQLAEQSDYSVSLGEMGFDLKPLVKMYTSGFDGGKHIIVPGNHDNYDVIKGITTFMVEPGYGEFLEGPLDIDGRAFYVRGAESIDKAMRTEGKSWWADEELSARDLRNCVEWYVACKPDIMVTHTAPDFIIEEHLLESWQTKYNFRTEQALQSMHEFHTPKVWIFGHFHLTKSFYSMGTTFISLGELATCDLDLNDLSFALQGKDGYSWGDGGF